MQVFDPGNLHVSFRKEEQKNAPYQKANPKGRVPAVKFGEAVLTETPAILTLSSKLNPDVNLQPNRPI